MQQTIYIDNLIIVNATIDIYILIITGILSHVRIIKWRLLLGGLVAGLLSLMIFLPEMNDAISITLKALAMAGIVLISFPIHCKSSFFITYSYYLLVNLLFGGSVFLISNLFNSKLIYYNNNSLYFDISTPFIIAITTLTYILLKITVKLTVKPTNTNDLYDVSIVFGEKKEGFKALLDTGNSLKEYFSGSPVIIINQNIAEKLVGCIDEIPEEKYRLIPYSDVSGDGVLKSFRYDSLFIAMNNKTLKVDKCYAAIREGQLTSGSYEAIINPDLINIAKEVK